jgi:hypothetical protein
VKEAVRRRLLYAPLLRWQLLMVAVANIGALLSDRLQGRIIHPDSRLAIAAEDLVKALNCRDLINLPEIRIA